MPSSNPNDNQSLRMWVDEYIYSAPSAVWRSEPVRPDIPSIGDVELTTRPWSTRELEQMVAARVRPRPPADTDRSHLIREALRFLFTNGRLPDWHNEPWQGTPALALLHDQKYNDVWVQNGLFGSWLAFFDLNNWRCNLRQETVYYPEFALYCEQHNFKLVQPPHLAGISDNYRGITEVTGLLPGGSPMA